MYVCEVLCFLAGGHGGGAIGVYNSDAECPSKLIMFWQVGEAECRVVAHGVAVVLLENEAGDVAPGFSFVANYSMKKYNNQAVNVCVFVSGDSWRDGCARALICSARRTH